MIKPLLHIIKLLPFRGKKFYGFIRNTTGLTPSSIELYEQAMIHKSAMLKDAHTKRYMNNERLEYLGDAILGSIVAEVLYEYFPHKNEGFLTKTRSRIVNRSLLNSVALEMDLHKWVKTQSLLDVSQTSILGDALEALIGAVYLDKGYNKCKQFVSEKIINHYIDLPKIAREDNNYKSLLIEWGQKQKKTVNFITEELHTFEETTIKFKAKALIDEELFGEGEGYSKKEAQQNAAHQALEHIELT
ncbi:ribonuclease III [Carboxylicivirga caseinilyticus]|uniref:ribonuclease III n=1 Tax=Carboxylicivirga caseinilyticus TaxID=3417572 RepID=UPI003D34F956|nr:ribonuclease III [Marinilabiliaceae bacterium A049]